MTVHWRLKCRLIGAATTAFRCWYDVHASRGITVMRLRRQRATCPPATMQALRLSSVATFCSNYRISCDVRHRRNCCPLFVGGVAPGGGGSCFAASSVARRKTWTDAVLVPTRPSVGRNVRMQYAMYDVKDVKKCSLLICFWNIIRGKVTKSTVCNIFFLVLCLLVLISSFCS